MTMRERLRGVIHRHDWYTETNDELLDSLLNELLSPTPIVIAHGLQTPTMINVGSWWIKGLDKCFVEVIQAIKDGK